MTEPQAIVKTLFTARYSPPSLPKTFVYVLAFVLGGLAVNRGLDYLTGIEPTSPSLIVVERLGSGFTIWGVSLSIFGVGLILSLLIRNHFLCWLFHGLLAIVYVMLTIALAQGAIQVFDGWRGVDVLIPTILHAGIAFYMRPAPREAVEAPITKERD